MISRRQTRQVRVGGVPIGGDAPVSIQSMTSTSTYDVDATVRQIRQLAEAGCDTIDPIANDSRRPCSPVPSRLRVFRSLAREVPRGMRDPRFPVGDGEVRERIVG